MNIKKRNFKSGNENGVIIAILAILFVIVAAIVGAVVLKDNAAIATFDGGKVTKKEYQVYYEMFASYLKSYGYDANSIPTEILNKAAQDKMILTDAKAAGVNLTDEDKAEVDEIFKNEEYIEYFKKNYTFSIDTLKQIYYNDYIIQAYIEKLATEASDDEVLEYINSKKTGDEELNMNEYDTSHILFSFTNSSTGAAMSDDEKAELKKKAEDILAKAKAGEDFATLAKDNSDDTATATNGGQYKMYIDGYTVKEFADAVKTMKAGEIYPQLVETTYGYHIIKLNAINENGRLKSETERQEYANSKFTNIVTDKNFKYDEEKFKTFVKKIDANAYSTEDDKTNADDSTTTPVE